jgi:ABC-2 type transport system permease protein
LLILIYNIKSYENERGFLSLILVQNTAKTNWLISRLLFYVVQLVVCIFLLLFYGAFLSPVFVMNPITFFEVAFTAVFYCLFWAVLFFFVLRSGKNILDNTLKMAGIYLLLTMVIPAAVHQWVSMEKPANLMTDFIDATREKKEALYDKPAEVLQHKLNDLFPEIQSTKIANDSSRSSYARNRSMVALTNELSKESITLIAAESQSKNDIVAGSYWFNPVMFFQNRMNMETKTHFQNYKNYRKIIQSSIDKQINLMVRDIYSGNKVNKERYLNYIKQSEKNE